MPKQIPNSSEPGSMMANLIRVKPKNNASVAQPVEQGPRTTEVAGSTPVASSTEGFNQGQRDIMANIVHHRVGMEEQRREERLAIQNVEALKADSKKRISDAEDRAVKIRAQYKYHEEHMLAAEDQLRKDILLGMTLNQSLPEKEEPKVEEQESEEIGRVE